MAKTPTSLDQFKDTRIERILSTMGYHFTLEEVSLEEIARYNDSQARLGNLDLTFVNKYRAALTNGAVFPPIVIYSNGRDRYVTLDGNHRAEAGRKAKHGAIRAYVIKESLTPDEAVYVSGIINASTNGKPITDKRELSRLVLAAAASRPSVSEERIGQQLGMSRTRVRNVITTDAAKSRLHNIGVNPDLLGLGESALRSLHTKITEDSVLKESAGLIQDARLRGTDVEDLLRSIAKAGSEADRIAVVQKEREERKAEIEGDGTIHTIPAEVTAAVNAVRKVTISYPDPKRWNPLTPPKREEFYGKIRDIIAFLERVETALEPIVAQDKSEAALLATDDEDEVA